MEPREREEHQPRGLWVLVGGLALLGVILAAVIASCTGSDSDSGAATTTAATTTVTAAATDTALDDVETTVGAADDPPSVTDALSGSPDSTATADLIDTALGADEFATLAALLDGAGLTETLRTEGAYTVFAPTDAAFAALPTDVLDALTKNPNALKRVLTYHVVPGALQSADLATGPLETVEGGAVDVVADGGTITVGDATVTQPDLVASNGVLHGIDTVLLPPDLDLVAIEDNADYAVYFATGSAELNAKAKAVVAGAAAAIEELPPGPTITLIGVADQRGDIAFNEQLSRDRAAAVQTELEALGAQADYVIDAKGAEANQNLAKARRVNIVLPR